jgi:hypothetical protein
MKRDLSVRLSNLEKRVGIREKRMMVVCGGSPPSEGFDPDKDIRVYIEPELWDRPNLEDTPTT